MVDGVRSASLCNLASYARSRFHATALSPSSSLPLTSLPAPRPSLFASFTALAPLMAGHPYVDVSHAPDSRLPAKDAPGFSVSVLRTGVRPSFAASRETSVCRCLRTTSTLMAALATPVVSFHHRGPPSSLCRVFLARRAAAPARICLLRQASPTPVLPAPQQIPLQGPTPVTAPTSVGYRPMEIRYSWTL
ncbi:hypothetical protein DFH08DRAFT_156103 [Mycena albidolilacea]|uniref:Uncharacterized protein n=1 Tax=Mycena albidolilacea TaxID=1033008 RepID=A0AAD7ERI6_9AGAR|nr:hypothetical protein DFH08DRAFT_156103 [Mycena albidolilacea]